ncbi:MAG: hypothetical protein V1913_14705 [Fibrobacterota bacterium]
MKHVLLADLVNMSDPEAVLRETRLVMESAFPGFDFVPVEAAFHDTTRLFLGLYPGYLSCSTPYHDLKHTTDCLLALTRLIHGACLEGACPGEDTVRDGLLSALFHDVGYLQRLDEPREGTGAKYTLVHVRRSANFAMEHGRRHGFSDTTIENLKDIILCTDLVVDIDKLPFTGDDVRLIGRMLGTADLLGQMADRTYLEKLLYLYREFMEGGMEGYATELELLRKTTGFHDFVRKRFSETLGGVNRHMLRHFQSRWNINEDLYEIATLHNMGYLKSLVETPDYRKGLRREAIVKTIESRETGNNR